MVLRKVWPELESNQRHKDFQSSALPTELSGQEKREDTICGNLFAMTFLISREIKLFLTTKSQRTYTTKPNQGTTENQFFP